MMYGKLHETHGIIHPEQYSVLLLPLCLASLKLHEMKLLMLEFVYQRQLIIQIQKTNPGPCSSFNAAFDAHSNDHILQKVRNNFRHITVTINDNFNYLNYFMSQQGLLNTQ
jgi:hypothetical protein